jgi:hypothetical protein
MMLEMEWMGYVIQDKLIFYNFYKTTTTTVISARKSGIFKKVTKTRSAKIYRGQTLRKNKG